MLVDGAIIGTAKAAVEGVDFVVNGVPAMNRATSTFNVRIACVSFGWSP